MKTYETLRTDYPAYISIDQMSVICKMAKRSVRYLVDNGIVPAIDTGKKTWRWKIAIDDVIAYLKRREQEGRLIPVGAVNSRPTKRKQSYSQYVTQGREYEVADYFEQVYADYPDVLTTPQIGEMTGMDKKSITRIVGAGFIKVLGGV